MTHKRLTLTDFSSAMLSCSTAKVIWVRQRLALPCLRPVCPGRPQRAWWVPHHASWVQLAHARPDRPWWVHGQCPMNPACNVSNAGPMCLLWIMRTPAAVEMATLSRMATTPRVTVPLHCAVAARHARSLWPPSWSQSMAPQSPTARQSARACAGLTLATGRSRRPRSVGHAPTLQAYPRGLILPPPPPHPAATPPSRPPVL